MTAFSVQSDPVLARWGFTPATGIALLVLLAFLVAGPFLIYPIFLMKILCFALFACAFNLLIGYVGLLSFGHAAYFGFGSYVAAWAAKEWGVTAEAAILLGGLTGCALGVVFGWLAIRRSGLYFAMITLALAQMVYFLALQAPFTGGEDGLQNVPRPLVFGVFSTKTDMGAYWMVAAVFLLFFLLIHRIVHSPFGQVLKGIRENEQRAISLGYNVDRYKLLAFVLSATISGVAGATKAIVFGLATLTDVDFMTSGDVILMTLLGGLGTMFGPIVGSAVVTSMELYLARLADWVVVIQGIVFVLCVLLFRKGIVGTIASRLKISL
jgi:branched-chain amino acid transport system permease protein